MKIALPELSLVLLVGPSGSGKSSFGRKHFLPTEVISSDFCRGLVSDNENDQSATGDAFDLLGAIVRKRLARGKLTVIDATNVQPEARKTLIELAREYHVFAVAIVFDLPERLCQDRNASRPDRQFGPHVVRNQLQQLRQIPTRIWSAKAFAMFSSCHRLKKSTRPRSNGSRYGTTASPSTGRSTSSAMCMVASMSCWSCCALWLLGGNAGWPVCGATARRSKADFVGDLVDRGPQTPEVLRLVSSMVQAGQAFCVPGNHDVKLVKALRGRDVKLTHGLPIPCAN